MLISSPVLVWLPTIKAIKGNLLPSRRQLRPARSPAGPRTLRGGHQEDTPARLQRAFNGLGASAIYGIPIHLICFGSPGSPVLSARASFAGPEEPPVLEIHKDPIGEKACPLKNENVHPSGDDRTAINSSYSLFCQQ